MKSIQNAHFGKFGCKPFSVFALLFGLLMNGLNTLLGQPTIASIPQTCNGGQITISGTDQVPATPYPSATVTVSITPGGASFGPFTVTFPAGSCVGTWSGPCNLVPGFNDNVVTATDSQNLPATTTVPLSSMTVTSVARYCNPATDCSNPQPGNGCGGTMMFSLCFPAGAYFLQENITTVPTADSNECNPVPGQQNAGAYQITSTGTSQAFGPDQRSTYCPQCFMKWGVSSACDFTLNQAFTLYLNQNGNEGAQVWTDASVDTATFYFSPGEQSTSLTLDPGGAVTPCTNPGGN